MPKRQSRFTPEEIAADPRLEDESQGLWNPELGDVDRRLLTSAVRCFAANGYHATTTRDIAAGVGLSPAALYVHFPSKELVLFEIMRACHEAALACITDPAIESAADFEDRIAERLRRTSPRVGPPAEAVVRVARDLTHLLIKVPADGEDRVVHRRGPVVVAAARALSRSPARTRAARRRRSALREPAATRAGRPRPRRTARARR